MLLSHYQNDYEDFIDRIEGRQPKTVKARSLLCYQAVREAGISLRTLAKRLGLVRLGYAVESSEAIVQESHYELIQ